MSGSDILQASIAALREKVAHRDRLPPIPLVGARMSWRFRAYRDLLQQLGHSDGMTEVIEVAIREFLDAARASADPQEYLIERSRAQQIVVDELDIENLPTRAITLFIIGAFQQLEAFSKDLVEESDGILGRSSRNRNSGESAVDWALEILPGGRQKNINRVGIERYLVLEYYRVVRNKFVHPGKSESSVDSAYQKVTAYRDLYRADFDLEAPNNPGLLSFDDFLLFTRIIKYVATDMCRIATPTESEIEAHAERQFSTDRNLRNVTWDTISREKATLRVVRHYKRYDYDIAASSGLVQKIVSAQFARVGRRDV